MISKSTLEVALPPVEEKKIGTETLHKPVLRNLLLLSVLGVVLALSPATLAEYYFVYFVDCAPCHDHE